MHTPIELKIEGFMKATDVTNPKSPFVIEETRNAIHYENMSVAITQSLSNSGTGFVYSMNFGNGGTSVDPTGIITYLSPNSAGANASLYNKTYSKVVNQYASTNVDPTRNYIEPRHYIGTNYSDIFITCLLDYGEPSGQSAFDTTSNPNSLYTFDEIGLSGYSANGTGLLLTHVIFHPIQKSLNRLIQIDYTVRIHSLTGLTGV